MKIIEINKWSALEVRQACIDNRWYTRGDNAAYSLMLEFVDSNEPTVKNIHLVATDIMLHSNTDMDVTSIMFTLKRDAVRTFYEIEEEGEE